MRTLIISVHPDDETLGCGGTILKKKFSGDSVFCIFITSGNENQRKLIDSLKKLYDFDESYCLELPELKLADISLNEIIPKISEIVNIIRPDELLIPNRSDVHSDHRAVFEALMPFLKSFRYPFINRALMYEIISETDHAPALIENVFIPNVFVDISNFMDEKLKIMSVFESEIMPDNLPRSFSAIKALGIFRGSRIGVRYAEAFMLLFEKC